MQTSRCIGNIMARDLRLVASRLYKMGVTRPWTCHLQPCRFKGPVGMRECWPESLYHHLQQHHPHYHRQVSLGGVLDGRNAAWRSPMIIEGNSGNETLSRWERPHDM